MTEIEKGEFDLSDADRHFVDGLIRSGEFGSTREVLSAGLSALRERHCAFEQWMLSELETASAAMDADPGLEIPAEQVFADLRERHRRRFGAG